MSPEFPKLIALSGPLHGQILSVDESGIRLSDECLVRLCDGRAVAYTTRDGLEKPWSLLDHNARLETGSSEFRLEHAEFDPEIVFHQYPDFPDEEIESFFLGRLMGEIARPVAAAVLLDKWNPGETAFATFLPGFFYPRYTIVDETRRQLAPGVYDDTEHVFCARLSQKNRYMGALYVKSLTAAPFRPEERTEIVRIAGLLAMFLDLKDRAPEALSEPTGTPDGEDEEEDQRTPRRISSPAELEIVFEDMAPAYRFGTKNEQPVVEEVPSALESLLDDILFGIFYRIDGAVACAAILEIPKRPLHFIRLQRPENFEIDKDVVYRAFIQDVDAARNADGTVWAVPIKRRDDRVGVVYVQIDPEAETQADLLDQLESIADVDDDHHLLQNLDRFF